MSELTSDDVYRALAEVIDPEVGINVVDLGLIYSVNVTGDDVSVAMTMTTAACPLGEHLRESAEEAIARAAGPERRVSVDLVWEPAWSPTMMSDEAKRTLGRG